MDCLLIGLLSIDRSPGLAQLEPEIVETGRQLAADAPVLRLSCDQSLLTLYRRVQQLVGLLELSSAATQQGEVVFAQGQMGFRLRLLPLCDNLPPQPAGFLIGGECFLVRSELFVDLTHAEASGGQLSPQ